MPSTADCGGSDPVVTRALEVAVGLENSSHCTPGSGSALACWTVDLSLPSSAFPDDAHGEVVFCQPPLCALYKAQQPEGARCSGQPGGAAAGEEKQCHLQVLLPCLGGEGEPY